MAVHNLPIRLEKPPTFYQHFKRSHKKTPTKLRSTKKKPSDKPITSASQKPSEVPTLKSLLQATINLANKLDTTTSPPIMHPSNETPSVTWEEQSEDPVSNTAQPRTKEVFIKLFDLQSTMYSDQKGEFPCLSRRGYRYLMVFYD